MDRPMQKVITKYYKNNRLLKRGLKVLYPNAKHIRILSKFLSDNHKIEKVEVYIKLNPTQDFLEIVFEDTRNIKVYEIVFADYDKLVVQNVIEIINSFEKFLDENLQDKSHKKRNMDQVYSSLKKNKNLPDELKLWLELIEKE